jgi:predicted GTPase
VTNASPKTFLPAHARTCWKTTTKLTSSIYNIAVGASILTVFSSDVDSLKKGIIKTSKNKVNTPYTILLVGETGVGKSSVLEFIANTLIGKDADHYDFQILDHTNEQSGSDNQSQTNSARLYELRSKNGIVVSVNVFHE